MLKTELQSSGFQFVFCKYLNTSCHCPAVIVKLYSSLSKLILCWPDISNTVKILTETGGKRKVAFVQVYTRGRLTTQSGVRRIGMV